MTARDQAHWDSRYSQACPPDPGEPALAPVFTGFAEEFPRDGHALDLACGRGLAGIWLALRGLTVTGVDVSPVAVELARELARRHGVARHCHFTVGDLDDGLPAGPAANVIVCQWFRDNRLDGAILERLAPGGLLAVSVLSEVGAAPGPFRVRAGELPRAFGALDILGAGEADGQAWLLGRR